MKKVKILAIDDSTNHIVVLEALLTRAFPNMQFFSAQAAKAGIELCLSEKPDVILLDIGLAGMDGNEVCKILKTNELTRSIPIVMMTDVRTDKESRIKALESGADAFLTKPLDESELTAQIRVMLRLKELENRKLDEKERLAALVIERTSQLETELNECKRTEKALMENEERFQSLFNQAPLGYQSLDFDGHFIEVNQKWLETLGYTRQEVIGKWFGEFLAPAYRDAFRQRFPLFKSLGQIHSEFEMVHKNGTQLFVAFEGKIGYDSSGEFKQTHCILQDITESKRAEKALQESEEKYRSMVDLLPDAVIIHEGGKILFANAASLKTVGADSLEQLAEKPLMEMVHPDYRAMVLERIKKIYSTGKPSEFSEEKFITLNNKVIDVEVIGIPIRYRGKPAIQTIIRDITERKRTEEDLMEREQLFRSLFNASPDAIVLINPNHPDVSWPIVDCNEAACQMNGYTREELLGQSIDLLNTTMGLTEERIAYAKTLRQKGIIHIETSHRHKDGHVFPVEVSTSLITLGGRDLVLGIDRDITERKKMETELIVAKEKAEDSEHELKIRNEELLAKNEFIQTILDNLPIGISLNKFDEGNATFMNKKFQEIYGWTSDEITSIATFFEKVYPDTDYRNKLIGRIMADIQSGNPDKMHWENIDITRKDGSKRIVNAVNIPLIEQNTMVSTVIDITERKQAEVALKESEERYRSFISQISEGMYRSECDPPMDIGMPVEEQIDYLFDHLYIAECNEAYLKTYGLNDQSEMIGKRALDIYIDRNNPVNRESRRQLILNGYRAQNVITEEINAAGQLMYISNSAMGIIVNNHLVRIWGTQDDITESMQAEKALKESEERYRSFISQVTEGVYRFESDEPMDLYLPLEEQVDFIYDHFFIAECNPALLKMYQYDDPNEMIGKRHLDFHGGRHNQVNRELIRNFIRNGYSIQSGITEEFDSTGQLKYISNNSVGIIENNHLVRTWGTETDITEKMKADQVQQVIFAISNAAMSSEDLKELLEIISSQLGKLLDSTNFYIAFYDEASGMLSTHFEKDQKDQFECWPAEKSITGYVVSHNKSLLVKDTDVVILCETGEIEMIGTPSKVWLGVPLLVDQKVIGAIVVQSYDNPNAYTEKDKQMLEFVSHQVSISIERKKAEQELKEALVMARESDRLKSAFLANVSHELRTPLNSILGFSDLMLDPDFVSDQLNDFAGMINASGNNLLVIINDIMDISKIEAGLVQLSKSIFSVQQLIGDIRKEYSFKALNKGIELRLDPSNPEKEIFMESDESKLRQILINFVGNAIKFTEEGFVEIGIRIKENSVHFLVKDSGIGIPQEYHDQIFERFRQVEGAETKKYGGTGLGLAIAKSLTELLGGEIGLESEDGKGSTFYFTIPL